MEDQSPKTKYTPDESYNPEDEYTSLDTAFEESTAEQEAQSVPEQEAAQASTEEEIPAAPAKPAEPEKPAEPQKAASAPRADSLPQQNPAPPHGAAYPPPVYPYPVYGIPYYQQPMQAPSPYLPGYMPPAQPYPAAPPYMPYPVPAAPHQPTAPAQQPESTKAEKPVTSTGTKAYLIILTALMVAMIVAFTVYVANVASWDKKTAQSADAAQPTQNQSGKAPTWRLPDNNGSDGDESDPFSQPNSGNVTEFEEEITLVEDKGETQQRDDDNAASVGTPDPRAKGVELSALPADKDDPKYTTQSAYESVCDSVVTVELFESKITDNDADIIGAGTGTIISADGYIVTNAHVVQNSRIYLVRIILNSGESYQAKIVGYDTWSDLAVLKIDATGLKPVTFGDSADIVIGQDVIAIGSPGGEKFQNSLTKGVVSAVDRELSLNKYVRYIQSDAAISPGNSGGPLCNVYGQVIGINTAKTVATYYEAMSFSVPSQTVQTVVNELLHYGYIRGRARIGFSGYEVSAEDQQMYGVPAGLAVSTIDPEGSFKGTDIREGDIVTAIDGQKVASFQDVYAILNEHKPGDKLTFSIYRVE